MSSIANIAIQDGAASPATHTFTPATTNPATYRNGLSANSASGMAFDESIRVSVKPNPDGVSKVEITMVIPGQDGLGAKVYDQANVTIFCNKLSTTAARKNIRVLLSNLLLNSQIVDAVDNLNPPY